MAYIVDDSFREKLYSGESEFRATLIINGNTIPNDQIASISISSPLIDDSKQVFNLGSFISQKITIKFKNMDGIVVESGQEVSLSIGQYIDNDWVDVPIGLFLIDDLAEDYYEKCEFSCLDYAVKFKPNIDYSECFTDGKANVRTILEYICEKVGVELGDCPTINDEIEVGTYDSTISGKQWVSYIAEIKGCNAKIDRTGKLTLQPLKQPSNVPINALESASFEAGDSLKITKVTFFDAIRNFTFGDDTNDTLFIRQDNPFINDENVIRNIYESIVNEKINTVDTDISIANADEYEMKLNALNGNTEQVQLTGKNLFDKDNANILDATIPSASKIIENSNQYKCLYIPCLPNTTYTISKVQSGYLSAGFTDILPTTNVEVKNYTISLDTTKCTITSLSTSQYLIIRYYRTTDTLTESEIRASIQVELGSTATTYEQYCGGVPSPNPDYPQNINTVTGRNIIKIQNKNIK